MSSNLYSPAAGAFAAPVSTSAAGPLLVASDGSEASEAALTAAALIAHRAAASVEVVSALEPISLPAHTPDLVMPVIMGDDVAERLRRERVRAQIRRHAEEKAPWTERVEYGRPADVVARVARERHASLIVTGLGANSILVRMFGAETPLRIARLADSPVLCVPPGFARLPRVVVVAVDFGVECARAAVAARPLLREATHVHVVHVKPRERLDIPADVLSEWEKTYEREMNEAFTRVVESMELPPDVQLTTAVLRGAPAREVLDFATSAGADLLVAGHGHRGRMDRLLGGSVASQLFRGTRCALLLAPDAPTARLALRRGDVDTTVFEERAQWPVELRRFSERNASRLATLEIDDAQLGAQVAARGYPLQGIDYDWRDDSVEIGLGDPKSGLGHLSHLVKAPLSLALQRGPSGDDRVLCIERREGRTLLWLEEQ